MGVRMEIATIEPTKPNPLGALFSCHEEFGVAAVDPASAIRAVSSLPLAMVEFYDPTLPTPGKFADVLEVLASRGASVVASHTGRQWFNELPEEVGWRIQTVLAFDTDPEDAEFRYEDISNALYEREVEFYGTDLWWPHARFADRGNLVRAVQNQDCGLLRFCEVTDEEHYLWFATTCDSLEWLMVLLQGCLPRFSQLFGSPDSREGRIQFAKLLDAVSAKSNSPEAAVLANALRSGVSDEKLFSIIDDVRHGRLT